LGTIYIQGLTPDDNRNSEEYRTELLHIIKSLKSEIKDHERLYREASTPTAMLLIIGGIAAVSLSWSKTFLDSSVNSFLGAVGIGCFVAGLVMNKDRNEKKEALEQSLKFKRKKLIEAQDYYDYAWKHRDKDGEYIYNNGKKHHGEKLYNSKI